MNLLTGILLFLPIPLVLWLLTAAPLGAWPSLALGLLLMITHRFYARPFALTRARRRCLWCGRELTEGPLVVIEEGGSAVTWRCCSGRHLVRLRGLLLWADGHSLAIRAGILGSLGLLLILTAAAAARPGSLLPFEDAVALFRGGIALTVLPLSLLGVRTGAPAGPRQASRSPFPLHAPALIGLNSTLWLFRLVGLLWLWQATSHLLHRIGLV